MQIYLEFQPIKPILFLWSWDCPYPYNLRSHVWEKNYILALHSISSTYSIRRHHPNDHTICFLICKTHLDFHEQSKMNLPCDKITKNSETYTATQMEKYTDIQKKKKKESCEKISKTCLKRWHSINIFITLSHLTITKYYELILIRLHDAFPW